MKSSLNPTQNQIFAKNPSNCAYNPSYKPVKQLLGYGLTCFFIVSSLYGIVSDYKSFLNPDQSIAMMDKAMSDAKIKLKNMPDVNPQILELVDYLFSFIGRVQSGSKLIWFYPLRILGCMANIYFYVMVLLYPDYCGGDPEFNKIWSIVLSSLLTCFSGMAFHYAFVFFTMWPGLINFAIHYLMYFGHDSSPNSGLFCLCLKPWVYRKIEDTEAPFYRPTPYPVQPYPQPGYSHQKHDGRIFNSQQPLKN